MNYRYEIEEFVVKGYEKYNQLKTYMFAIFLSIQLVCFAQQETTLTDSLARQFDKAWNENNLTKMISLVQSDAFFKSPYQLQYSRDTMAATVLTLNPPIFRNIKRNELYSNVKKNIAWSIGRLRTNIYY